MKVYVIDRSQVLHASMRQAWRFFSDPCNLQRITPPWLDFRILSCPDPPMHPGMIVTYDIGVLPLVRTPWVTEITHVREGSFFVDEQRLGPYRFWHHQHHFQEVEGGVSMRDLVHYALPLGPAGRLTHRLWIRQRLEAIFDYRTKVLAGLFGENVEQDASSAL